MSNISRSPSAERPRTPTAVNFILAHVTRTVEELQALHAKTLRGEIVQDMLTSTIDAILKSTSKLLEESTRYEDLREQLEEQERARQAAEHPLVSFEFLVFLLGRIHGHVEVVVV